MGTSIGLVIDWLVSNLATPAIAAVPGALIVDGYTAGTLGDSMMYIGRTEPTDLQSVPKGNQIYPTLGTRNAEERFDVAGFIDVYRDGTTMADARNPAIALYDVLCHLLAGDPTLGGLVMLYADVSQVIMHEFDDSAVTARRRCVILFRVTVRNRYHP